MSLGLHFTVETTTPALTAEETENKEAATRLAPVFHKKFGEWFML